MKKQTKKLLSFILAAVISVTALVICALASDTAPALEINGANVSFESTVHLWYSVGYKNIDNPNEINLLIWRESSVENIKNCTLGTEDASLTPTGDVNDGKVVGKTFDYGELAAAEMTENVYARAYINVDGNAVYSSVVKYSILQYSLNMLGITGTRTENEELITMLNGMLVYGSAAQQYFDTNLDRLATDSYVKMKLNGATFDDGTTTALVKLGEKIDVTAEPTDTLPYVIWTNTNGKQVGSGESCKLKATANMTYTAILTDKANCFGAYDHVAVIGVDGAGTFDWNGNTETPNIDAIFADGAVTYSAIIPSPTSSGPSWMSSLHGVPVENHGINDNALVEGTDLTPYPANSKYPSYLRAVKEDDPTKTVAAIYGWQAFDNMIEEGLGIYKVAPASNNQATVDETNTAIAVDYVKENKPELLFFHFGNVDTVGHADGWGTETYYDAINTVDGQIKRIYDAYAEAGILENTLFILTADHGGLNKGHGGLSDTERYVMFAATGKTVANNSTIGEMYNRDTAAIVLYALGVEAPDTYMGIVPTGLFDGVEAGERKVYNDPDSPRYHETVDTPADATTVIGKLVNSNLIAYLPFDGNITESIKNAATSTKYTVEYTDGYFGSAVDLSDGHVILPGFAPGTDSFTISMWMKVPAAHLESTVLSNKAKGAKLTGIDFSLRRNTSVSGHQGCFNLGYNNADTTDTAYDIQYTYLPDDYQYGWTHVMLIVDRENNTFSTVYDFGKLETAAINSEYINASLTAYALYIGKDANNNQNYPKLDLSIDEFMIFDGALSRNDINDLCEYYGKTPTVPDDPTILDVLESQGKDLTNSVYLDFDKTTENSGTYAGSVTEGGTVKYTDGQMGAAMQLGQGTNGHVKLDDYSFTAGKSFTFAFWINPTDLTTQGNNKEYEPILSTMTSYSGKANGFTLMLNTNNDRIFFNASDGTQRYYNNSIPGYTGTDAFPENFVGNWTHIAITVNVGEDGQAYYRMYVNFTLVYESKFNNVYSSANEYSSDINGDVLTVGQYSSGTFANPLDANIDELLILEDALTEEDIAAMAAYYGITQNAAE